LFDIWDLETFLKEHEGEWWTPYEIGKELKVDIRTVKNTIRMLDRRPSKTTYEGWRLDIAERGDRLYVVRIVRDIEDSKSRIRAEISEVESIPEDGLEKIFNQQSLIIKHSGCIATRDAFLRYLQNARHHHDTNIRLRNLTKLTEIIREIKRDQLEQLNKYLRDLSLT